MTGSLWVDKYAPSSLDELTFHPSVNESLSTLSSSNDVPHILFTGPRGAGKMTRIRAFLKKLYDSSVHKLRIDENVFQTPSGKKIELTVFSSNYHVEINPSEVGIYDRIVIQEVIKELAQTQQIDRTKHAFKVAVIMEADRLTKDAQHALRRTMEKYSSNLRLILCCSSYSRILPPIKSRCFMIRVPSPSDDEIIQSIQTIEKKEHLNLSESLIKNAILQGEGNVRRILLSLETAQFKGMDVVESPDWELKISQIANQIIKEQSPQSMLNCRSQFYELLTHAIPTSVIMRSLNSILINRIASPAMIREIIEAASFYEYRIAKGNKAILHLEAFTAKAMYIIASKN